MDRGLGDRLFNFSIDVIQFLRTLEKSDESRIIKNQLTRCATSCGANYEEAQGAISSADFKHKMTLVLKEMRESNYWLRILEKLKSGDAQRILVLIAESEELKKILGSICSKLKDKATSK